MRPGRRAKRDDSAVSEVLGFILSFALSAIFLMLAMSSFWTARNNSDGVITGSELRAIADRIAGAVVEAGLVGQEWPNSTMNVTVQIPQTLNGHDYYVEGRLWGIYVNATDGFATASATTFKLDALQNFAVSGRAYSINEHVTVTYSLQDAGATKNIHLHGE